MTIREYLLRIDTSAPDHKLSSLDGAVAREMELQFGKTASVMVHDKPLKTEALLKGKWSLVEPVSR